MTPMPTCKAFVLSAALAAASLAIGVPAAAKTAAHDTAKVEVAFTPGDDIAGLIVKRIERAKATVRVQAYLFTDRRIANALLAARKRGVEVEVIGDAAQQQAGGLPHLAALHRAGVRVFLDGRLGASHNKIVIVDGGLAEATVVTGSYNFTHAAQSKNAENVVVISGNRTVTDRFVENFETHRRQSTPWP
jgi:phosphatidylserine/phosphatidylglycerophosphate/cardiolipin synthase-like enzyme